MTSGADKAPERGLFVDVGYRQRNCRGEKICGDAVAVKRLNHGERTIAILSDGLGHGVKASIMALMTSVMAMRFVEEDREIVHSAEIIMDALPVCRERRISYATFSIADVRLDGRVRIIEMGNPAFVLMRGGRERTVEFREVASPRYAGRTMRIYSFDAEPGDRAVIFSDGVSQAGLGCPGRSMGWRRGGCVNFLSELLMHDSECSARALSEALVEQAVALEKEHLPEDDISCCTVHFRRPRRLLFLTGMPINPADEPAFIDRLKTFAGRKAVCGSILARKIADRWHRPLTPDPGCPDRDLPPAFRLDGIDLVTEGIHTMTRVAAYLERDEAAGRDDAAGRLGRLLLDSDVIEMVVGSRVNAARQDPRLPLDLELRREMIGRIAGALRSRYLREVTVTFV